MQIISYFCTIMNEMISVIVCTYNQENTIGRTLESILMQQCHVPIEIVIGEDCSTDNTLGICREYEQRNPDKIRVIANNPNKGLINNYFDCILASKGKYIADCAGDDFWIDPLKLEKEVSILEANENVTLVHTDWNYYNVSTGLTSPSPRKPFPNSITRGYEMLNSIITQRSIPVVHLCTSLYRADIIRKALADDPYMFRNDDFGCEDIQIIFTMAQSGDIAYLPDVTLNYSRGQNTVSYSPDIKKKYRFISRVTALSYYISQKFNIVNTQTDEYFQQRVFELAMHAFRAHDTGLRDETLEHAKEWKVKSVSKIRFVLFVMRHPLLWRLGLIARKVFVTCKRVLRGK